MFTPIPAIDIIDGHCVRLQEGDYDRKTTYDASPADVARHFEELGAKRLHIVDLDGAKASHIVNIKILEQIASTTNLTIDFGGGIKHTDDLKAAFDHGASMVTVGSLAVTDKQQMLEWAEEYGPERFIVGADARDGKIMIRGWKDDGGILLSEFIGFYMQHGIRNVLCTDISRDGMLHGPNIQLYQSIMAEHPECQLIASGGVSSADDLLALQEAGIPASVFGRAYYEGKITDAQLTQLFKA